ncbi:hypothetical protein GCM10027345_20490 [Hymenobacter daeguensis]
MPAAAEAGKGLSRISQGEILWAMFLFGVCVPVALGLGLFSLMNLSKSTKPNMVATLLLAVLGWWFGLYLMFKSNSSEVGWWILLLTTFVPAALAGYGAGKVKIVDAEEAEASGQDQ